MKKTIIFLLPFLVMAMSACMKSNDVQPTPIPDLSGTWSGSFYKLRINTAKTGLDTANKIAINLSINTQTGFAVTGDTATVHAGSKGNFQYDGSTFAFADVTASTAVTQTKVHLNGYYAYLYTAAKNRLQMSYEFAGDTLVYYYDLKKQ